MTTTKSQEKKKSFMRPHWIKNSKLYLSEGSKIIIQGMLFSLGGYCTNRFVCLVTSRNAKAIIKTSSNVVELKNRTA